MLLNDIFDSGFILFIVNVELVAILHYYGCIWFRVGCVLFLQLPPDLLVNYGIGKAVIDEGLFYVLKCLIEYGGGGGGELGSPDKVFYNSNFIPFGALTLVIK